MCDCCDYIASQGGRPGDRALTRRFELLERTRIREAIRAGSWRITTVEAEPGRAPSVAYTIGLWSLGRPELVIFGLDRARAGEVLNAVGEHLRSADVADGDALDLDGWPLAVFDLPNPAQVLLEANWFYRRGPKQSVPALQLVYPDAHGVWPWEPGCHLPPGSQPFPGSWPDPSRGQPLDV